MFALADCNNFFVSCERVFRPELNGKPVVVLSSNDGCAIARSNEAKRLGIKMGAPLFQIRDIVNKHDVTIFSSNMQLYADFSRRVRMVLREYAPHIEVYSIDEAFLDLRGIDNKDFDAFAKNLSSRCRRLTGIPISVGVAPTKTLAKIAAELCKSYPKLRGGCYMHREEDIVKVLKKTPIEDVWGIGRRSTPRLKERGVTTAYDFRQLSRDWVQRNMGITGVRTWQELHGIPAIGFESIQEAKHSICNSRSFASEIYSLDELSKQVAKFATMTAEKLRSQNSVCGRLTVFAATNRFHSEELQQYGNISIPLLEPTDSTIEIVRVAREALSEIYVRGVGYKKAGVIAMDIVPRSALHVSMFSAEDNERHHRLMQAIDNINQITGKNTITIASAGGDNILTRSNYRSPRYTTEWNEIPVIK
ncbi:MAG: Y-family DNA polymerase [Alistipes sp.]|nr:Y-family DNA polymerase [Alistipes sp.]